MQTVVETPAYLASAKDEGMSAAELKAVVDLVAANPLAGDVIVGTGGCRKLRIAGKGKGKSGGYRVVTFYSGEAFPVFLIAVLAKGSRADFTGEERSAMAKLTKSIVEAYRSRKGRK